MRDRNKSLDLMNDIDTSYKFRLPQNVIFNLYIFKTYIIYIYIYIATHKKVSSPAYFTARDDNNYYQCNA